MSSRASDNIFLVVSSVYLMAQGLLRTRPDVTLGTADAIRRLLVRAGVPVSRNRLLRQLARIGRSTTRPRLNRVLRFYFELGLAVEGSKGVQWTHSGSASLRRAQATGRRL